MLWKWWLVGVAIAQTTLFWIVYAVWGAADKELTAESVECRGKMSFGEYCGWQIMVEVGFVAIVAIGIAFVFLLRVLAAKLDIKFLGLDRPPDLRANLGLLGFVAVYAAVVHVARFMGEAIKSFVNYENYLYDTLPRKTADAIRECERAGVEGGPEPSDDGCPLYPENLEEMSPGIGGSGLQSRPRALARHAIRLSLVHWIAVVYTIFAVLLLRGLVTVLTTVVIEGGDGFRGGFFTDPSQKYLVSDSLETHSSPDADTGAGDAPTIADSNAKKA